MPRIKAQTEPETADEPQAKAETRPQQVPSVGRVVHVVTFNNQHRPAHIVDPGNGETITVIAFIKPTDIINAETQQAGSVLWYLDECPHDPTGKQPGSYHWPEYVPAK